MNRSLILCLVIVGLFASPLAADVPQVINYQGRLLDEKGQPVADATYRIRFSIFDRAQDGELLWEESQEVEAVNGLFATLLGSVEPISDNVFTRPSCYLSIRVGEDPEMTPRTRLVSNGYAYYALRADTAGISMKVIDNSITSAKIVDGTISSVDLAAASVGSSEVIDNSLTANDLASNSVGASEIAAGAVGTSEVADNSLTAIDLASSSVGSSEITDGTIVDADISGAAAIGVAKISGTAVNLSSTQTITGTKKFGDSTMKVTDLGVGMGSPATSSSRLLYLRRKYNTTSSRYGLYVDLDNLSTGANYGVFSDVDNDLTTGGNRYAFRGEAGSNSNILGNSIGIHVTASGGAGAGVYGIYSFTTGAAVTRYAGYFLGDVEVSGTLTKSAGAFKIDHPLDPANKYLMHSFVESPDMMNVYNGNVVTDANGEAIVTMPDYFETLNREFRYQLTPVGGFAPIYIAEKINSNTFRIAGGAPGMEVSWQVTGVRQDAYANAHRLQVEVNKPLKEKGLYLHPIEHGLNETKQLHYEMRKAETLERERASKEEIRQSSNE